MAPAHLIQSLWVDMNTRLEREIQKTTIRFILAAFILLIAAIGLSFIWNRSIKDELAVQAASFVRKGISSQEMRGVVEFLNGVQFSAFSHVSLYSATHEHIITLPPVFDRRELSQDFLHKVFYSKISIPIYLDTESKNLVAESEFVYSRFELVPYALLVWLFSVMLLSFVFNQAKKKVTVEFGKELKIKNAEIIEEMAKKVRHNIRSPLASLRAIFIEKLFTSEVMLDQGLGVIKRLEEIIENLRPENLEVATSNKQIEPDLKAKYDVVSMLKSLIAEKKLISKDIQISLNIENETQGIYTYISNSEFKQMLSNIVDNSIQSIKNNSGSIEVLLSADDASFSIEIKDNGCGISEANLSRVFEKHFTFGKKDGSGLGLYMAKKLIESNHGNIEITSRVDQGTKLSIILPKPETPSWHISSISINDYDSIVLCDDQPSIISAWKTKLESKEHSIPIRSYSRCEDLAAQPDSSSKNLFLVDFDLGAERMTGLQFLERHQALSPNYVLVTGHFDEPWIQRECSRLQCKLLPKDNIFQIEIL